MAYNPIWSSNERDLINLKLASAITTGSLVKVSNTTAFYVEKAGVGDFVIGRLESLPKVYPGNAGICITTRYTYQDYVVAGGTIAVGDRLKLTTEANGFQRYIKFVSGTDAESLDVGIALEACTTVNGTFTALLK
jgi:hypothetical protein